MIVVVLIQNITTKKYSNTKILESCNGDKAGDGCSFGRNADPGNPPHPEVQVTSGRCSPARPEVTSDKCPLLTITRLHRSPK